MPRPPSWVAIAEMSIECSGRDLLDVRVYKNSDIMLLKPEHKSLSQVFQFLGWAEAINISVPNRGDIFWEMQNLNNCSANCLLESFERIILLRSFAFDMAFEMNSLQIFLSSTGEPNTLLPLVISYETPFCVELVEIIPCSSSPIRCR